MLVKLHELGYKNIYFASEKEKYKYLYGDGNNISKAGFTTSKESRDKILANFEDVLRNAKLKTYSQRLYAELKTFIWNGKKITAMKGYNDDLIMSLAIGSWLSLNNSNTYSASNMQQADAILKGMQINNTVISPFYNNRFNSISPMIPVIMSESQFGSNKQPTKTNPLGDLSWLIGKNNG
jgi:hypothetical protein